MGATGSLDEDIGDGVVATGILRRPALIPDFWKIGTYQDLSRGLQSGLGLTLGSNYFEFAYDWRRDNRVAAKRLARESHSWLTDWRGTSGNEQAKLIFVTHSMGGLIARHLVEVMEGWKTTRAIFAIGTPYRGSGHALAFLSNGMSEWWLPDHVASTIANIRGMDSVYQLLPTEDFLTDTSNRRHRITDVHVANVDAVRARAALLFHEEMREAAKANQAIAAYAGRRGSVRTVIGTEQPTSGFASLLDDGTIVCDRGATGSSLLWGDGIVPRASATPPELGEDVAAFVPTSHALVPSHESTIAHIRNAIAGLPEVTLRDRGGHGTISLLIGDIYRADGPVTLVAMTAASAQFLELTIRKIEGGAEPIVTRMYPQDREYRWQGNLAVGSYSATVSCPGTEPAADLFFVHDAMGARHDG
jgi:hypothetical protein